MIPTFAAPASAHARLRAATRDLHDRAEAAVGLPGRVGTLDDYRAVLGRFWGFHAPLEAALQQSDLGYDYAPRARARLAAADLKTLGAAPEEVDRLPVKAARAPPGRPEALGVAYVLEGSTLGGRVIARELRRTLGADLEGADNFFDGRSAGTGQAWRSFLLVLARDLPRAADVARAEAAAAATFQDFIDWFGAPNWT